MLLFPWLAAARGRLSNHETTLAEGTSSLLVQRLAMDNNRHRGAEEPTAAERAACTTEYLEEEEEVRDSYWDLLPEELQIKIMQRMCENELRYLLTKWQREVSIEWMQSHVGSLTTLEDLAHFQQAVNNVTAQWQQWPSRFYPGALLGYANQGHFWDPNQAAIRGFLDFVTRTNRECPDDRRLTAQYISRSTYW